MILHAINKLVHDTQLDGKDLIVISELYHPKSCIDNLNVEFNFINQWTNLRIENPRYYYGFSNKSSFVSTKFLNNSKYFFNIYVNQESIKESNQSSKTNN